jgi:hypothetical protein
MCEGYTLDPVYNGGVMNTQPAILYGTVVD